MKRPLLNLVFVALCFLLAASTVARSNVFVSNANITFRVFSDEKSFSVDEDVRLNYRITNVSDVSLYVPREWEATCPPVPHIWVWFLDSSGNHLSSGYAGDCNPQKKTISERMNKEAVLLKPGESTYGPLRLFPKLLHLGPGRYRVEASVTGWVEQKFNAEERSELEKMGHPFVTGEVPASLTIILAGDLPDHPVDHRL
jgi:hypothetical protein